MGLAVPTSIMVGTGRAAEIGVLFRKGDALQSLQNAKIVVFDKTGTLTAGRPELTDIIIANGFSEDEVLARAAAVEARSEHPIGKAITREAESRGLELPKVMLFRSMTGFGLHGKIAGETVLIGADRLLEREKIDIEALKDAAQALGEKGRTPIYVAIAGKVAAVIGVADPVKPSTKAAIAALHALGLKTAMVTGDNKKTANAIAHDVGIDIVAAEVLPDGKVEAIRKLKAEFGAAVFVGDGINDAPALASADTGIAIGTGTDVAIESADIVLMSGDLNGIVNAFDLSRRTMANIRQNLFWAFGYNVVLIPVAAGVLYPAFGLLLSPVLAAGAMAFSSVFVLMNALRLRFVRPVLTERAIS
jgi:Cu+-exporting ATPase